ncbi:MAG: GSU2403 family nucleotidyltransferase fold protein [Atribacterota bacterium]
MTEKEITIEIIRKVAEALKDNLSNLIFIGGIASFLYHYKTKTEPMLYTYDIDALFSKKIIPKGMDSIDKAERGASLRKNIEKMGFVELPRLEHCKSSGKFTTEKWGSKGKKVKIELLLPLIGKPRGWGQVEPGLEAEALRYLDILINNCWQVNLGDDLVVNIPHPARYIIQKLLIHKKRKIQEREKESAYIADIINLYFDHMTIILKEISNIKEEYSKFQETKQWVRRAIDVYKELFEEVSSDGTMAASSLLNIDPKIIDKQAERFIIKLDRIQNKDI